MTYINIRQKCFNICKDIPVVSEDELVNCINKNMHYIILANRLSEPDKLKLLTHEVLHCIYCKLKKV